MRGIAPAFSPAGRPKIPRRPSAADFPNSLFVGGFNGLILPIGLSIFTYVGFARPDLMDGHVYNRPLLIACAIVCILTWYMGYNSIGPIFAFLSA